MAEIIEAEGDVDKADKRIGSMLAELRDNDELTTLISLPTAKSDLAGQLMVYGHEAPEVKKGRQLRRFQTPTNVSFLQMPWPEAIAAFRERGIVDEQELSTLLAQYRKRGDEATRLLLEYLQRQVRSQLEDALQEGQTFRDFAEQVADLTSSVNLPGPSTAYSEMVFRTNIQTAYGAGRFRAINDPDVAAARPYWEYRTAGDGRVRASHAILHRNVFEVGNSATDPLYPPGGFSCRCAAVSRSRDEIGSRRVLVSVPTGALPDEGFRSPPPAIIDQEIAA